MSGLVLDQRRVQQARTVVISSRLLGVRSNHCSAYRATSTLTNLTIVDRGRNSLCDCRAVAGSLEFLTNVQKSRVKKSGEADDVQNNSAAGTR